MHPRERVQLVRERVQLGDEADEQRHDDHDAPGPDHGQYDGDLVLRELDVRLGRRRRHQRERQLDGDPRWVHREYYDHRSPPPSCSSSRFLLVAQRGTTERNGDELVRLPFVHRRRLRRRLWLRVRVGKREQRQLEQQRGCGRPTSRLRRGRQRPDGFGRVAAVVGPSCPAR